MNKVAVKWLPQDSPTLVSLTHFFSEIPSPPQMLICHFKGAFRLSVVRKPMCVENHTQTRARAHTHEHILVNELGVWFLP